MPSHVHTSSHPNAAHPGPAYAGSDSLHVHLVGNGMDGAAQENRIYINLGEDGNGNWLGFRFENDRIPNMSPAHAPNAQPRFCSVAGGDLTNSDLRGAVMYKALLRFSDLT